MAAVSNDILVFIKTQMPFDTPLIIPLLDGELTSAFGLFFYF